MPMMLRAASRRHGAPSMRAYVETDPREVMARRVRCRMACHERIHLLCRPHSRPDLLLRDVRVGLLAGDCSLRMVVVNIPGEDVPVAQRWRAVLAQLRPRGRQALSQPTTDEGFRRAVLLHMSARDAAGAVVISGWRKDTDGVREALLDGLNRAHLRRPCSRVTLGPVTGVLASHDPRVSLLVPDYSIHGARDAMVSAIDEPRMPVLQACLEITAGVPALVDAASKLLAADPHADASRLTALLKGEFDGLRQRLAVLRQRAPSKWARLEALQHHEGQPTQDIDGRLYALGLVEIERRGADQVTRMRAPWIAQVMAT